MRLKSNHTTSEPTVYSTPKDAILASIKSGGATAALVWSEEHWNRLFECAGSIRRLADGIYYSSRPKEPRWCVKLLHRA